MSTISINGVNHPLPDDPRTTLLDFLHQELASFGTKKGCDHGQCGACTVIVDGRRVNACLIFAFQLQGKNVKTIEGIADGDDLHKVQQAFIDNDAFQCGFCTPGQICSSVATIKEMAQGEPSIVQFSKQYDVKEDIKERMSGNLCRCGAYPNIIAAVETTMTTSKE
ncbi:2Fe-2S iron-sulfur cluster-binding protein [Aliiglaciecola sp. LCG003]|uniref:(2Fe-2S)-binding protein n=1 Tax=Aliiglaciecola sp. LCG003 TaxID=3053655 RepID=UPI00257256DB|nr:2Fe-2S iron-sulfur cluster-binding protein [Aliiglaciecola sp. LCG003]WJG08092.1 2Fe-2S iron-sulfur cluster-binding protein [Aliiglaciecola sp. LCG003]